MVCFLLVGIELSSLSPGNHPLHRKRNLSRTSGAKCRRNLEAAAIFKHRHNVIHENAVDEPKSGRCDIHGSLRIVQRIRFIGAPGSQLSRELRGVLSMGKLMENPRQIVFGIGVLIGMLLRCD